MWPAIIGGIAGLVSGVLASLVAPWVHWRIEKQRQLVADRKARIEEWRAGLAGAEKGGRIANGSYLTELWFTSLAGHVRPGVLTSKAARTAVVDERAGTVDALTLAIGGEIDRLAEEWDVP
jgi:hypothetical protein